MPLSLKHVPAHLATRAPAVAACARGIALARLVQHGRNDARCMKHATTHSTTHSFLLYVTDCVSGGETVLHSCRPGDAALAKQGGVAPGPRTALLKVAPRSGRLLLMPLECPHSAAAVVGAPKVLIRGEVLIVWRL